ncbi:hypothetical protein [Palleronia sp.]|uniref:hypothetical protein n=1 Tax=Palleronia sp. TaxID=1940284 RepID=UPI0035C7E2C5
MRSVVFHVGFALAAATGLFLVLFGLVSAAVHVATFLALAGLSGLLIAARFPARPEAKPVRIRSDR